MESAARPSPSIGSSTGPCRRERRLAVYRRAEKRVRWQKSASVTSALHGDPRIENCGPSATGLSTNGNRSVTHIDEKVAEQIRQFASSYAPDVAIGVLDLDGLRRFWGDGFEGLNVERPRELQGKAFKAEAGFNLFSDVNQWLLKVILGQRLSQQLINVPRGEFRNASQLADLANVSVMSAFRFLRQLEDEGFLDDSGPVARLANLERLLSRWQSALLKPQKQISCRWLIRGGDERRLVNAINKYQSLVSEDGIDSRSVGERDLQRNLRLCLGGYAAASWLGFGHVSGMPPLLYLERINSEVLGRLGLVKIEDSRPADVLVKIPSFKEALFRAAVIRNNIRISDVVQIWLESSVNSARGVEQADHIKRCFFAPIIQDNA